MKTEKKEVTLYVGALKSPWDKEFKINVRTFKQKSGNGDIHINFNKVTVEIDVPDIAGIDFNKIEIDELKKIKSKYLAEVEIKTRSLDEQIQNLKALTFLGD